MFELRLQEKDRTQVLLSLTVSSQLSAAEMSWRTFERSLLDLFSERVRETDSLSFRRNAETDSYRGQVVGWTEGWPSFSLDRAVRLVFFLLFQRIGEGRGVLNMRFREDLNQDWFSVHLDWLVSVV